MNFKVDISGHLDKTAILSDEREPRLCPRHELHCRDARLLAMLVFVEE